jgi:hypothetical protein
MQWYPSVSAWAFVVFYASESRLYIGNDQSTANIRRSLSWHPWHGLDGLDRLNEKRGGTLEVSFHLFELNNFGILPERLPRVDPVVYNYPFFGVYPRRLQKFIQVAD